MRTVCGSEFQRDGAENRKAPLEIMPNDNLFRLNELFSHI